MISVLQSRDSETVGNKGNMCKFHSEMETKLSSEVDEEKELGWRGYGEGNWAEIRDGVRSRVKGLGKRTQW